MTAPAFDPRRVAGSKPTKDFATTLADAVEGESAEISGRIAEDAHDSVRKVFDLVR